MDKEVWAVVFDAALSKHVKINVTKEANKAREVTTLLHNAFKNYPKLHDLTEHIEISVCPSNVMESVLLGSASSLISEDKVLLNLVLLPTNHISYVLLASIARIIFRIHDTVVEDNSKAVLLPATFALMTMQRIGLHEDINYVELADRLEAMREYESEVASLFINPQYN